MLITNQAYLPSRKKYLQFVAVFSFIAIALFTQSIIFNHTQGTFLSLSKILLSQILVFNLYAVLIPLFIYLGNTYPPFQSKKVLYSLSTHLLVSILSTGVHLVLAQIVYHFLWDMMFETFYDNLAILFQKWFYVEVLVYWVIVIGLASKKAIHKEAVTTPEKLGVKHKGQTVLLDFNQLDWLQAYDAHVKIHVGDSIYLKRCKISDIEKQLPPDQFQRIHRSVIVNVSKIKALEPYSNGEQFIILDNNERLKLSRSFKGKLNLLHPV